METKISNGSETRKKLFSFLQNKAYLADIASCDCYIKN